MGKLRLCLIFGGQSAEHAVSLESAKNVFEALDPKKYDVHLVGIDKSGAWRYFEDPGFLRKTDVARPIDLNDIKNQVFIVPGTQKGQAEIVGIKSAKTYGTIDMVFPILHGPYGEDGTMQGYLRSLGVPYAGCGVLGSAVGMDKDVAKRLCKEAGLPIGKFAVLKRHISTAKDFDRLKSELGLPFFLKPANMGSSVGVHKVDSAQKFESALKDAFQYDTKLLVEEFLPGREVECSVLGNEKPMSSTPGEIIPQHDFYSYDAKYLDDNGALLKIPADLTPAQAKEVKDLAIRVYETLCCDGMARVDFFLRKDGKLFVNEVNTIPGFTKISMYPKMWNNDGLGYSDLIDRLIELGASRFETEQGLSR
jgi:D-alanine-D-alanine ligase